MAAHKSTALKRNGRIIPVTPKARTARDTARQRAMCDRVIVRKGAPKVAPTVEELRDRHSAGTHGQALHVTIGGHLREGAFRANTVGRGTDRDWSDYSKRTRLGSQSVRASEVDYNVFYRGMSVQESRRTVTRHRPDVIDDKGSTSWK